MRTQVDNRSSQCRVAAVVSVALLTGLIGCGRQEAEVSASPASNPVVAPGDRPAETGAANEVEPDEGAAIAEVANDAGDAVAGKRIFNRCRSCHALEANVHRVGPSLHGLFGRDAAAAEGYNRYSQAMKDSGLTWNRETVSAFIEHPVEFLPGTTMVFPGLTDLRDRDNLIAYLEEVSSE